MTNLATLVLRGAIHAYRLCLASLLPGQCRYLPSCSHYGLEALQLHGPVYGSWLTLRRLLRCQPWGGHGHDPVPRTIRPHLTRPLAGHPLASRRPTYKIDKATPHV
ncbi:MAG: membrane protein insertion efficiency factor YidD [Alphaproteobacteria bacterium]|nr:membrane protein insertion efficiency factor YidD [Alphaproteobacteria bacterium]MBL6953331.1 membrane protein insertion efficiency factor YidD [Alphaproteobacteria bacterium]